MRRQTNVIRSYFSEFFDFGCSFDCVYFGDGNFLFFLYFDCFGVLNWYGDDQAFFVGFELIECFLTLDESEGFGPIIFSAVAHRMVNLNKL